MNLRLYSIDGPVDAIPAPTAVTIGVFDGVHRGHQALISQLSTFDRQLSTLVVSLTSHPSFVLGRRDSEYWLDDPDEHLRLLFAAGVKYVAAMSFSPDVASLSACSLARLLYDRLAMRALLMGYDSRFGSRTDDDFDRLPQLAGSLGFDLRRGEPFLVDGAPISSSRIRQSLLDGDVLSTAALLGRPYSLSGRVVHGRGVGHTLGFPTANVDISLSRKMRPAEGVYAVSLVLDASPQTVLRGMANLGPMPTFGVDRPTLEVHLLDYSGDLYGQHVTVLFRRRLRDTMRFQSPDDLRRQLQLDLVNCR